MGTMCCPKEKITYPMEIKNQNVLQKQIPLSRLSK